MRHASTLAPLLVFLLSPSAASQQTVVLIADRDNTIYSHPSGALSNGAGTRMFVGTTGNGRVTRGVLHFDVAGSVPAGSRIVDVRFDAEVFFSAMGAVGTADQSFHRVLADWGEGSTFASGGMGGQGAGGPATAGSVTHLHTFFPSTFWQTPGGDFEPTPSSTFPAPTSGFVMAQGPGMVADVQGWVDDPTSNFGWILKADDESRAARVYRTREFIGGSLNAMLSVTFDAPIGASICGPAALNASGLPGEMSAAGSTVANDNNVTLTASQVTPMAFGFFIVSDAPGFVMNPAGSFGNLCLSGSIGRYQVAVQNSGAAGRFSLTIDLTAIPQPVGTLSAGPGDTLYFQAWYRDQNMGAVGSNFTDALAIDFL